MYILNNVQPIPSPAPPTSVFSVRRTPYAVRRTPYAVRRWVVYSLA